MTKRLTLKQLRFVNEYVSNDGKITATEAAKRAGYGESRATVTASELLNPQKHPEVVRYIDEMKKEMAERGMHGEGRVRQDGERQQGGTP